MSLILSRAAQKRRERWLAREERKWQAKNGPVTVRLEDPPQKPVAEPKKKVAFDEKPVVIQERILERRASAILRADERRHNRESAMHYKRQGSQG